MPKYSACQALLWQSITENRKRRPALHTALKAMCQRWQLLLQVAFLTMFLLANNNEAAVLSIGLKERSWCEQYTLFQNGGDPGWSGSSCTKTRHRGPRNTRFYEATTGKWTDILRIQEKKAPKQQISLVAYVTLKSQGFCGWWIPSRDPDLPRSKLSFIIAQKCFHSFKIREEPHN